MPSIRICVTLILSLAAWSPVLGQSLPAKLDKILTNPRVFKRGTRASMHVATLPSGRLLYRRDDGRPLIPASNQKLLVTASALERLEGPPVTEVYLSGRMEGDVLHGDLVIRGGGDPTLNGLDHGGDVTRLLADWARFFRARGLRKITGDVIADDRIFDRQFTHPGWPDNQLHKSYCAPVAGVSLNGNCLDFFVSPGPTPGAPARSTYWPPTPYIHPENDARTVGKGSPRLGLYRRPGSDRIRLGGTLPVGGYDPVNIEITVQNPPRFFAAVFYRVLRREGIAIEGRYRAVAPQERLEPIAGAPVLRHETTLEDVLRHMNVHSDNMYAESLLKLLGTSGGRQGTFDSGARAVERYMRTAVGAGRDEVTVSDGSGLCRNNRVSARAIAALLQHMTTTEHARSFIGSLPVFGVNGTVENRLDDSPARGKIAAKTGYIRGVATLSGYIVARSGRVYVFSFLTNNIPGSVRPVKRAYDEACEAIYFDG